MLGSRGVALAPYSLVGGDGSADAATRNRTSTSVYDDDDVPPQKGAGLNIYHMQEWVLSKCVLEASIRNLCPPTLAGLVWVSTPLVVTL